jgi:long-chain acyl-CoA synthetase
LNLAAIIDPHPDDRVAIISRSRPTTYGELRDQVARVRGGLAALGVRRGDRVAVMCSNGRYFVDSYLAVVGLGAIAVPLNPTSPAPELEHQIATVGAVAVVVDTAASVHWHDVSRERVPSVRTVVVTEPVDDAVVHADVDFAQLLASEPMPSVDVEADTVAVLMFTSGTAGSPQAAMLSHGNLLSNIDQGRHAEGEVFPDDVVFGVLPLNHIFGLNVILGLSLERGATVVLVQRFDPYTALETIRERGVTVIPGAPPMWVAFSHFDDAPADSFASVRLALTGAAKMPEPAMRRLRDMFGIELAEGYGLTEASPVVTSAAGLAWKPGSVGKVLQGIGVRLVDADGTDVVEGDSGEIWVRGPNVFLGYWENPEQTAKVLTADGWLRTGDIAVTDAEGFLYLVDRAKDLIIVSGFNVFPAEVEAVLAEHPAVREVGVVGVPHPLTGEAVKAYVVVDGEHGVDEESLISWCTDHLARYKCPTKVLFVDELPRNAGGKLLRRELV